MARTPRKPPSTAHEPALSWRARRAAGIERRKAETGQARQLRAARKKLRCFKPTLRWIAGYADQLPQGQVGEVLAASSGTLPARLAAMVRVLVGATSSVGVPGRLLLAVAGALVYVALPADVVPDLLPLGFVDDAMVVDVVYAALAAWQAGSEASEASEAS